MKRNKLPNLVFILLFLLLPRDASAAPEPQYVVLVPTQLYVGVREKACVLLSHLNETVSLTITLEYGHKSEDLFTSVETGKSSFSCTPFAVPDIPFSIASITVRVRGPTLSFVNKKSMTITKTKNLIFVQTDKPIYKPGQTVKFRIVSVDINFLPQNETFPEVYIENPKRNRIVQWKNYQLQGGLGQLSFPLSVEPPLGTYMVVVKTSTVQSITHSFLVEEYVLPKFEVTLTTPKTISLHEIVFQVSVCGRYTYGQPVPGLVTINVCRERAVMFAIKPSCNNKIPQRICEKFTQKADNKGCVTRLINTEPFRIELTGYSMKIQVEAIFREEGTDLEFSQSGSFEISHISSKLKFTKADSHYRPGIPFFAQVLLVDAKDQPISNETVVVSIQEQQHRFITNEDGLADISIDTTGFRTSFLPIFVTYKESEDCSNQWWLTEKHVPAHHSVGNIFSHSNSFLHLEPVFGTVACGQTQKIRAHYILNKDIMRNEKELIFYYLVKARGSLSKSGTHVLPIKQGNMKGVFSFSIEVDSDIAPTAELLIFTILPNGEMIADTDKIEVEKCFANKVNMSFSSAQGLPASDTNVKVTATPHSLCALQGVDKSVLLVEPTAEPSPQSFYNSLPVKTPFSIGPPGYDVIPGYTDDEPCPTFGIFRGLRDLAKDDTLSIILSLGLHVFTNSKIHKPRVCYGYGLPMARPMLPPLPPRGPHFGVGEGGRLFSVPDMRDTLRNPVAGVASAGLIPMPWPLGAAGPMGHQTQPPPMTGGFTLEETPIMETIRQHFPETWIWDLVVTDESGQSELVMKIPDTITEWKANALCLSERTGLGLSSTVSLQAFQPFFLELTLPYSVVRGEAFTLKATVFNYLSHNIRVAVQLQPSSDFLAVSEKENVQSYCISGNGQKTVSWAVTPKTLGDVNFTVTAEALHSLELCDNGVPEVPAFGQKDTVIKPLLVEPEGIEREETFNTILCASETRVPEKLSLKVPSNVVEASVRATCSVLGDILGSAMQNLQNLVKMPSGCGEQNMVLFVPNIYVLNYLNGTGQLTEDIKFKAINHLTSGYQRQLNYKHRDGSYSAFGDDNTGKKQGNTWLTAFVLKSFVQAQEYISVDNSHITDAFKWLMQKQKKNGCFQPSGSLFNTAMKGGVEDEVTLSAYITIAMLEMPMSVTDLVVHNALSCLETAWQTTAKTKGMSVYSKALFAYAFALAGNKLRRDELLNSLDLDAIKEEDSIHWERAEKPQVANTLYSQQRAPSAEVEMTAYVLLALLTAQPAPSSKDLSVASRVVKWITKQQNPYGGFSSTQDTVVALQALSKYGAATFSKMEQPVTVSIKSSDTFSQEFQVDEGNRLLLQEVKLPNIPGDYSIAASGPGCVYVQTTLKYNVLPKKEGEGPFSLSVDTSSKNCDRTHAPKKVQIHINTSYTGERPKSNMAIVDVKMVSGFLPVKASVKKLKEIPQIQRTEVTKNHVLIYFEELTSEVISFSFSVEQDIQVKNLKPATVNVYDYYETDEFTIKEYNIPCSAESEQIMA